MQHPIGMGRGFPSYGAMGPGAGAATSGFAGAPGPSPAYGYGKFQPVISHQSSLKLQVSCLCSKPSLLLFG